MYPRLLPALTLAIFLAACSTPPPPIEDAPMTPAAPGAEPSPDRDPDDPDLDEPDHDEPDHDDQAPRAHSAFVLSDPGEPCPELVGATACECTVADGEDWRLCSAKEGSHNFYATFSHRNIWYGLALGRAYQTPGNRGGVRSLISNLQVREHLADLALVSFDYASAISKCVEDEDDQELCDDQKCSAVIIAVIDLAAPHPRLILIADEKWSCQGPEDSDDASSLKAPPIDRNIRLGDHGHTLLIDDESFDLTGEHVYFPLRPEEVYYHVEPPQKKKPISPPPIKPRN